MSFDKDDFYIVLPSNASPNTHPENTASNFTVDWNTPIQLDPNANWKVALTEINYVYQPHTISSNLSITYDYVELVSIPWKIKVTLYKNAGHHYVALQGDVAHDKYRMVVSLDAHGRLLLRSKTPFDVNKHAHLGYLDDGLSHILKDSGWYEATSGLAVLAELNFEGVPLHFYIDIVYYDFNVSVGRKYNFTDDTHHYTAAQLVDHLRANCQSVFSDVKMDGRKISFQMAQRVSRVRFEGGLNFSLGFIEQEFRSEMNLLRDVSHLKAWNQTYYKADYLPQLNVGIKNMFIYASCVAPISVGHARCPLLKNIFVDASHDANLQGNARNYIVQHLMYVDVTATLLNSITINIRNDAGYIIGFPKGAVTVITAHFKKFPKQL